MDINFSMLILLCFIFFIIGAVFILLLQYYIYMKFSLLPEETAEQKDINFKYKLPTVRLSITRIHFLNQIKPKHILQTLHQTALSLNRLPPALAGMTAAAASAPSGSPAQPNAADLILNGKDADASSLVSLNFVLQFLFHELKNSNRVRKWFYRKLSLELDELIAKTTTGKLFDKLTVCIE